MKNKCFHLVFILIIINHYLFINAANCQPINGIYGIYRIGTSNYNFAKLDLVSGSLSILHTVPFSYNSLEKQSSFINPDDSIFYFSNGNQIAGLDLKNNALVLNATFSIPANESFNFITYYPCDSNFYGLHYNGAQGRFAKYDPSTGVFADLGPVTITGSSFGEGYLIDLKNQLYVYKYANFTLKEYDINTGQNVQNINIQNLPSESFRHVVYDCMDSTYYGASVNPSVFTKYFSTIDPFTGIVNHVSGNNLNSYVWKNATSLFTIDPFNGIYYFVAAPNLLVGVNVNTGAAADSVIINAGANNSFDFITYFTQCTCNLSTGVTEITNTESEFLIFPNPADEEFVILQKESFGQSSRFKVQKIEIINLLGEVAFSNSFETTSSPIKLQTSNLPSGIYIIKVYSDKEVFQQKLVISRQ